MRNRRLRDRFTTTTRHSRVSCVVLGALCVPLSACEAGRESDDASAPDLEMRAGDESGDVNEGTAGDIQTEIREVDADDLGREVVYLKVISRGPDGALISSEEFGSLDLETWRRVSRPYTHLYEEYLYDEEAGFTVAADGSRRDTYRITRVTNSAPPVADVEWHPLQVRSDAAEVADALEEGEMIDLLVRMRDVPRWDIPLLPEPSTVSVETYAQAESDRELALAEREEDFISLTDDLRSTILDAGGAVLAVHWTTGWLGLRVDQPTFDLLTERDDVEKIDLDNHLTQHIGNDLGDFRDRVATDAITYWDAGFNGENGTGALTIGIQEQFGFNDESCFFDDDSGCDTTRLAGRWKCFVEYCESFSQSGYTTDTLTWDHGTVVSSIAIGDYTQNQAEGFMVCDTTTSHSATFEADASGYAKEALVVYFDHDGASNISSHVTSAMCANGINVELFSGPGTCYQVSVLSSSNGWTGGGATCSADSSYDLEDAYESLFDDGVFIVMSAGNSGTTGSSCNVSTPADIPKTFAVNGLTVNSGTYHSLPIDPSFAVRGGGSIESPNGTTVSGALAMIDLSAPSNSVDFVTQGTGHSRGCVTTSNYQGTSFAAPAVAGMAAMVKDWGLNDGHTWIANVGRLHTVMLAMGDRADSTGGQHSVGADNLFGLGRAKLRLVGTGEPSSNPGGMWLATYTLGAASADQQFIPFEAPVAIGADLLKCVMMMDEDMSSKDNISRVDLEVRLRAKQLNGTCAVNQGSVSATRINADHDHKKMVAFEDSDFNIEDKCVEVTVDKEWLSSSNSVTLHVFCMYTSEQDDAPD